MGCTQGTVVFEFPSGEYDYTGYKEHYRDDGTYSLDLKPQEILSFTSDGEYKVMCSLSPLIAQCQEITIEFSVLDVGWSGLVDIVLTRKGEILFGQEIFVATSSHQEDCWTEVKQKLSLEQEIIHSAEVGDVYQVRRFIGGNPNMKLCIRNLQISVVGLHHAPPICLQFEEWLVDKTFYLATNQSWKWYPKSIDYWVAWVSAPPLLDTPSRVVISFQIKLSNVNKSTPYERRDFQGKLKLRLMRHGEVMSHFDIVCCRYETQQVTSKPVRMMFDSTCPLVNKAKAGDYYDIARIVCGRNEQGAPSILGIHVKQFSLRISGANVCCTPLRQKIGQYVSDASEGGELEEELLLSKRAAETSVSVSNNNTSTNGK